MTELNPLNDLWHTLETQRQIPQPADRKLLSSLLEDDIQRLKNVWGVLPVEERRELIQSLHPLAAEDFELDFSAVFTLAMGDEDAQVRAAAIDGLLEDEDVRLVPALVQALTTDASEVVRAAAAHTLAHFVLLGELKKIRARPFGLVCHALITAYNDPTEALVVRCRAIEALGYTGLHGVPEMIKRSYAHADELMRISAVQAMGRSADDHWAAIVREELNSPYPAMRYEATRACGELTLSESVPALVELVEDVNIDVQTMALWALGQIGGNTAQRTLERYTHTDNPVLRQAAQEALDELEFFHGDLSSFFGPPTEFDGESDMRWDDDEEGDFDDEDEDDNDDFDDLEDDIDDEDDVVDLDELLEIDDGEDDELWD